MPSVAKLKHRSKRLPLDRAEMMARIRSSNTSPEQRTGAALHALGLRYRKNAGDLPGKPDFCNRRHRWVVFVHGCFWHCHKGCALASSPKTNVEYWAPKLRRNVERDNHVVSQLRSRGCTVFILWECETRKPFKLNERTRKMKEKIEALRLLDLNDLFTEEARTQSSKSGHFRYMICSRSSRK